MAGSIGSGSYGISGEHDSMKRWKSLQREARRLDQRYPAANRYNSGLNPKTAFLFPGQGSQAAGMGKALADSYPAARRGFEEADDALGFALSRLCFEGPDDQLKLTENTQPALLTVSTAAFAVLVEAGHQPDYVAGH